VLLTGLCVAGLSVARADDAGSVEVRLTVANATGAALQCQALAAHWYSFPVLLLPPGQKMAADFAFAGGVVFAPGSPIPLEAFYCGFAGRAWATRGDVAIRDVLARAVKAGGTARVTCRVESGAVTCAE
jgi:hypothetical protein